MKILAVSDKEDTNFQDFILKNPEVIKSIDFIVSCGDLSRSYLEFLVDSVRKPFFFVEGNHATGNIEKDLSNDYFDKVVDKFYNNEKHFCFGGVNLHSRMEVFGNYILVGFEGCMRYNRGEHQYTEKEMSRIVKIVSEKIRIQQIKDFFLRRKKKKIIVISHAPIIGVHDKEDLCHQGFKCFKKFCETFKPEMWFHGHVHFEGQTREQRSKIGDTTVINVYGMHMITTENDN
ncbi:MAG: metallophosphoesterase [Elusimicrobia bacterium]|nr:metallophosphoesterase [Elusimicrobiota bacterium]